MRIKTKRNKLFRTWLLIQLCFLAFMTAVTTGVYFYTNHHIKQQLDALHMSSLERTEAEVGAVLDSAIAAANEYTMQPRVRTLSGADLSANERDVTGLVDDIKQTNSVAKGVSEVIIYFRNEDVFVTSAGVMDKDIFNEVYPNATGEGSAYSILDSILDDTATGKIVPVYNGRSDTDTAIYTENSVNDIYVSVVIDRAQIEDILSANLQSDRNVYCVFSGDELLYSMDGGLSEELCETVGLQEYNQFQTVECQSQRYVYLSSSENEQKYVSLIDEGNYLAGQLGVQRTAIIMLAASIMLGARDIILYHAI